jgi:hypothetical protein
MIMIMIMFMMKWSTECFCSNHWNFATFPAL